jgi:hypothetical protein
MLNLQNKKVLLTTFPTSELTSRASSGAQQVNRRATVLFFGTIKLQRKPEPRVKNKGLPHWWNYMSKNLHMVAIFRIMGT